MARHELCTTVDYPYLCRALVMHRSLVERGGDFSLRIVCMDDATEVMLDRLALPGVVLLPARELESEDPALAAVRPLRTMPEYCWTMKASLVLRVLARESELEHLAWVDADHTFWSEASPLVDELGDGSVLVVPQRTDDDRVGRFNAGYILFRRCNEALRILEWWRERCLERCEATWDDIAGDQRYLIEWPGRFDGVRVLQHPGGGVAPWNVSRADLRRVGNSVTAGGRPLLFYHQQSFRLFRGLNGAKRLGLLGRRYGFVRAPIPYVWTIGRWYELPEEERTLIWAPYAQQISEALATLLAFDPEYDPRYLTLPRRAVADEALRKFVLRPGKRVLRRDSPPGQAEHAHG